MSREKEGFERRETGRTMKERESRVESGKGDSG